MSGTIKKVFLVIGVLVLCLIIWGVFFGGALGNLWNVAGGEINKGWTKITGEEESIIEGWNADGKATVGDQKDVTELKN